MSKLIVCILFVSFLLPYFLVAMLFQEFFLPTLPFFHHYASEVIQENSVRELKCSIQGLEAVFADCIYFTEIIK